jgi:hypothetical protein
MMKRAPPFLFKAATPRIMKERLLLTLISLFVSLFLPLLIDETSAFEKSWTADFKTTVIASNGNQIIFTGRFYQSGPRVRFEPTGSEEVDLYDFDRALGIRLFPEDRIYFENRLTPARMIKAAKEGWISTAAHPERWIFLREGKIKERDARLYLIVFGEKEPKAYSLRWITADEAALPLQVIYPASGYETVIVEYDQLRVEPVNPEHFESPTTYLNLNPY